MIPSLIALVLLASSIGANATPLTISDPFLYLRNRAINLLGYMVGEQMYFGAESVVPDGRDGTTGFSTTIDLSNGRLVSVPLNYNWNPFSPHYFSASEKYDPAHTGPRTLAFANGTDTATTTISLPPGARFIPFIDSIALSGSTTNPTFNWNPPANTPVNCYLILIRDRSLISRNSDGLVAARNLSPNAHSYTVAAEDFTTHNGYRFAQDRNYTIEIQAIQTIDGSSNLSERNVKSVSTVFADFTPNAGNGPPVILPVASTNNVYQFNVAVVPGQTYYIDPEVAIGYDYAIGIGDPYFRSVLLPVGIGDGLYDIYGYDDLDHLVLLGDDWVGGTVFDFGASGVTRFRVTGIEVTAALDPSNPTAFVTGLTFTRDGQFTGTQTPIVQNVSEPTALALFGLAFAGLGVSRRSRTARLVTAP